MIPTSLTSDQPRKGTARTPKARLCRAGSSRGNRTEAQTAGAQRVRLGGKHDAAAYGFIPCATWDISNPSSGLLLLFEPHPIPEQDWLLPPRYMSSSHPYGVSTLVCGEHYAYRSFPPPQSWHRRWLPGQWRLRQRQTYSFFLRFKSDYESTIRIGLTKIKFLTLLAELASSAGEL
jgi:hypothetical protein